MNYLILSNNQKAEFKNFSASKLLLHNINIIQIEEIKEDDNIIELRFNNEVRIRINDIILVSIKNKEVKYIVKYITSTIVKNTYVISEFIDNDTKYFLTPMFNGTIRTWFYNEHYVNAYLKIKNPNWIYSDYKDVIYLMFKKTDKDIMDKIDNSILSNPYYLDKYDKYDDEDRFIFYVMKIPDEFAQDVKFLKKGRFKDFSQNLKNRIINFHFLHKESYIYKVLNNDPELRKEMSKELKMTIPSDISLKSKPKKHLEIYG